MKFKPCRQKQINQILTWVKFVSEGYSLSTSFTNLGAVKMSRRRRANVLSINSLWSLCFLGFFLISSRFSLAYVLKESTDSPSGKSGTADQVCVCFLLFWLRVTLTVPSSCEAFGLLYFLHAIEYFQF